MTLRTTSVRRQWLAWALLTCAGVVAYFVLVAVLDLGNPFKFFGPHQMRVFLPLYIVFRLLAHECRWVDADGPEDKGLAEDKAWMAGEGARGQSAVRVIYVPSAGGRGTERTRVDANLKGMMKILDHLRSFFSTPVNETLDEVWARACGMEHDFIPDPEGDAEYLELVFSAAERGHVQALIALGDHAFHREAFVEAYFWTMIARCRQKMSSIPDVAQLQEINHILFRIRRAWSAAGQPLEYENVYDEFPEERGELGRAFLRLDSRIEVEQTFDYILMLVSKGNPDAALFATAEAIDKTTRTVAPL